MLPVKIDLDACHNHDVRALRYADRLLRDTFRGDQEAFRKFFGLRKDSPAFANIVNFAQ
jgi:hypothetical protein